MESADPAAGKGKAVDSAASHFLPPEHWEDVFAVEDPWQYGRSEYEKWKFGLTLSLLPEKRAARAVELACAEGHLTALLAPHVDRLLAYDISKTALGRARVRCADFKTVEFHELNLADGALPAKQDLVLCSEVLFYLSLDLVEDVAKRIASSLKVGGHVLLAHGNQISDDRTKTGFDWGHAFGAETIGKVFAATEGLSLVRQLSTPLFTIHLFRRNSPSAGKTAKPPLLETLPLPHDLTLPPDVEKTIIWDGAVMTRKEAQATESASKVPILMYHSIADDGPLELAPYRVAPAAFREQLRYLRRHGYHSITLGDWADCLAEERPVAGRPVIITFDDGYKDFFENAWPALERADFTATVFAVTEKVGGAADWDGLAEPLELMDWDQLKAIAKGGITVASHTASHKDLSAISISDVRRECGRARIMLQETLGHEVDALAFPWGRSTAASREAAAQCGYRIGVRSWGGPSPLGDDPLNIARIEIEGGDSLDLFAQKLNQEAAPVEPQAFKDIDEPTVAPDPADTGANRNGHSWDSAMPSHRDYRHRLAAQLDGLIGQFVKLQNELLSADGAAPATLQQKLTSLFALPVTGKVVTSLKPDQEIVPGIQISFEAEDSVTLSVEPKADHTLSPESYLNSVGVGFSGVSQWRMIAAALEWKELSLAERFQFSIYARPSRPVSCDLVLRLPRVGKPPLEVPLASLTLRPEERNATISGNIAMPDFIDLNTMETPQFALFFDTDDDLSVVIHYLNCYFA
jgi:peptidoglycan/xylan/chitin deacetylase (PgdA/CDA1 family)/2-polyprenyl-3-methyl-5-hydroxy-6-metoxy-1,4-benzoquinol methylase